MLLHYRKRKSSPKKSPSKSLSDSRAGAGTNYKSKEYISSSGSNSSGSDSDDKPLKKKPKKDQGTKEKKKKEKAPETKRKSKRQNKGSESESSVGEVSISDPCNVYSFYLNWFILERQLSMILITSYETTVYWKLMFSHSKCTFILQLPDEEEILDTPPSSGKSASESESDWTQQLMAWDLWYLDTV